MFDAGLFELLLIGIVALLVVGPERLPHVAKVAGLWVGKGKRFLGSVQADIEKELKADELKRILEEQKKNNPLHEIIEDTTQAVNDIKEQTTSAITGEQKPSEETDGGTTKH